MSAAPLAVLLLLLALPLTLEALKCYNCDDCSEVSVMTETATGCSSCLVIPIRTTRKRISRKCAKGKVTCNAPKTFLDDEVKVIATNANEGLPPTEWKPYDCCSTKLCNATGRNRPSWSLLLLTLIVVLIWNSSAFCELRDSQTRAVFKRRRREE